jgi:two-component system, NtrC family, sensor histidine kinase HydH
MRGLAAGIWPLVGTHPVEHNGMRRPGRLPPLISTRWQTVVVALLFVASVAVLVFNSVAAFLIPRAEQGVRTRLVEAADRIVREAAAPLHATASQTSLVSPADHERLAGVVAGVLRDFPGVEGGFYLGGGRNQFAGYAYPTDPHKAQERSRREPPPLETPYIRLQAQQSLDSPAGTVTVQALDVGPSRVLIATAPLGVSRPAPAVVWAMYRVTGPEEQADRSRRLQLSTYLALAGMAVALALTISLGRNLRQERQIQETLRDDLRRSEHLASLGMMLASVAHEVRNPLAGIRSTVQLWQRLGDEARTPASLEAVIQAVDRLNMLVGRLLQFARPDHSTRSLLDLNALVAETAALLRAKANEQKVEIATTLAEIPPLAGSAQGIEQVLLNLATNALEAMPSGGRLEFGTRFDAKRNLVQLEISDTGVGIPPEARERLFEPFFTTRPEGTGLGLALCREIVAQHGGQITLEPRQPCGTRCLVSFPGSLS